MRINETILPGCFELIPERRQDARGYFAKIFNADQFAAHGLETDYPEEYYTYSKKGVIRGLHFQEPPMDLAKLVFCFEGAVLDVLLDLRVDSPTYGKHAAIELSAEAGNALYIPHGIAHGFQVTSDEALLLYKVSKVYSPAHDSGVLWNSAGIAWPIADPILSDRDLSFKRLADYASPFKMAGGPNG